MKRDTLEPGKLKGVYSLIATLRQRDVILKAVGDDLEIDAPDGAIKTFEFEALRSNKPIILEVLRAADKQLSPPLLRRPRPTSVPLSYAQQRLWFVQLGETRAAYNMSGAIKLAGRLKTDALKAALNTVIERHEILRTTFEHTADEPEQVISSSLQFQLQTADCNQKNTLELESEVERQCFEEASAPFDLAKGPLIRGRLLRVNDEEHVLLVTMHHIVSDGWSVGIFTREIAALYQAYAAGKPNPLPQLPIQYADYAIWQREWLQGEVLQEHIHYWKKQLVGASEIELQLDYSRPAIRSYQGADCRFPLSKGDSTALFELTREMNATLYMTMLTIYHILLSHLSGQRDVVVASPIAGRDREETNGLIGFFVNILLVRVDVDAKLSFCELLAQVKQTASMAYAHQALPFDKLVAELRNDRTESAAALARVAFTLRNEVHEKFVLPGLTLESLPQSAVTAKTDLSLTIVQHALTEMLCVFEYSTDLFDKSTIELIGKRFIRLVEQIVSKPNEPIKHIDLTLPAEPLDLPKLLPLSAVQRTMWLDLQARPEMASYFNIVELVEIRGPFDADLFQRALQHTVSITSALRLRFSHDGNGLPKQEILSRVEVDVPLVDFSNETDSRTAAQAWVEIMRNRRIDPIHEVPFRYALLKLSEGDFYWYRQYHHLVLDGAGLVLQRERVAKTYDALVRGVPLTRASDEGAYRNYLHRDAEYRYSAQYASDRDYWKEKSFDGSAVNLSARNSGPTHKDRIRAGLPLTEDAALGLQKTADEMGVGFSRFVIATIVLYLHKISGANPLAVGVPVHGRFEEAARDLVAACSNVLPAQFEIDSKLSVKEFIGTAASQLGDLLQHGRHRIGDIRRLFGAQLQDAALHNTTINVLPYSDAIDMGGCIGHAHSFPRYDTDLIFLVTFSPDYRHVLVQLDGNAGLYERWELEHHLHRLSNLLVRLSRADQLAQMLHALNISDGIERQRTLEEFNATAIEYPRSKLIHELFEEQVKRAPLAVAVACEDQEITFGELNRRANQLAHYLRKRGVGPEDLVAICVDRSIEMVVGLLGILKSGGAYVPLDPSYPSDRLKFMLRDAAPKVVLTEARLNSVPPLTTGTIVLDYEWTEIGSHSSDNLAALPGVTSRQLAYVIYTSGSTGQPKGVMVEHQNVVNHNLYVSNEFALSSSDRVLQFASFCFDASVEEIFPTLLSGSSLILRPNTLPSVTELAQRVIRDGITVLNFPTAYWHLWATEVNADLLEKSDLRLIVVGGEKVSAAVFHKYHRGANSRIQWVNTYGPTETTVSCTAYRPQGDVSSLKEIPIGRPIANTQLYLLDSEKQPVPIGVAGEIYIGGAGVARGYLNRPELTAERFTKDSFSKAADARMYKTGDLGRWRADGNIEYLGRNDHQVKIRGFRIELGEIESQLARHPQIGEAVVIAREDVLGEKRLIAYVTHQKGRPSSEELRAHLKESLPEYMLPSAYVQMKQMPLTQNGKLDRKALPDPELPAYAVKAYAAPQGEIEETLAKIWQKLLHVERVGRHDNFFELGGHSLLAVQLKARVQKELDVGLGLREMFDRPTLMLLAELVENSRWVTHHQSSGTTEEEREVFEL